MAIGPITRAARAPRPSRAVTAEVMPPLATTTPAPTRRATSASASAMRRWLAGSTRAGSRSRSVATTASPPLAMRPRAASQRRSISSSLASPASSRTRAETIASGWPRASRSSWAVVAGTNEPQTTSTPRAPSGGATSSCAPDSVSTAAKAGAQRTITGVPACSAARRPCAITARSTAVSASGITAAGRPSRAAAPIAAASSAAPVGPRRRASESAIASSAARRPPLRSSAQRASLASA